MHIKHKMGLFKKLFGKSKTYSQNYREKSVKILVVGKENVGKTSIISRLCGNEELPELYKPTLYDVSEKSLNVDECNVVMQFMELGGSQPFPSMLNVFIRQADIFILVYAIDDPESFQRILAYRDRIVSIKKKHTTELPLIVVQNKTDLRVRKTKKEMERRQSVAQWCYLSHNVSAKTEVKIYAIMNSLIEESKFIGNESDLGNVKISGRIVYNEETESTELYHKAPNVFKQYDNSDEKMIQRREKLKERKLSRSRSFSVMSTLRKSTRLRRSHRNVIVTRKLSVDDKIEPTTESQTQVAPKTKDQPIKSQESFEGSNSALSVRSTSNASTIKDPSSSAIFKRKVFRTSKTKTMDSDCISEDTLKLTDSPAPALLTRTRNVTDSPALTRTRRKSLSSNDLSRMTIADNSTKNILMSFEKRSRCSSVTEASKDGRKFMKQRSISVHEQPRKMRPTKDDIVHTTLKEQKSNETIPVIKGRIYNRSFSFTTRHNGARLNRKSSTVDEESESEENKNESPLPDNTQKKSLSHNDLLDSIGERFQDEKNPNPINAPPTKTFGRKKSTRASIKSNNSTITRDHSPESVDTVSETTEIESKKSMESLISVTRSRSFSRTDKRRWKKTSTMSNHSTISSNSEIANTPPVVATRALKKLCRQKSSSWHELPHTNNNNNDTNYNSLKNSKSKPFTNASTDALENDSALFEKISYNRSTSDETSTTRAKNWIRSFSIDRFN